MCLLKLEYPENYIKMIIYDIANLVKFKSIKILLLLVWLAHISFMDELHYITSNIASVLIPKVVLVSLFVTYCV